MASRAWQVESAAAMAVIKGQDLIESVAAALQFVACFHPADYIRHLAHAYDIEAGPAAKEAIAQILVNARMAALGRRPMCQDTGIVNVFIEWGMDARLDAGQDLDALINEAVHRAYRDADNPLRATMVFDPLFDRTNTRDNTPAIIHTTLVPGSKVGITVAAKGGGSENKARFVALDPDQSVADWVIDTIPRLGAGWCPPGLIGLGIGGSAEKAMLMAKQALMEPIDMSELIKRGPASQEEEFRLDLYTRINALGIGAQGLGGLTTVVDVKVKRFPCHAASLPVGLIPQCAANRHVHFELDGSGPAVFDPPDLSDWPEIALNRTAGSARRVNLDALSRAEVMSWRPGETLLLNGRLLTGRDAAHRRFAEMLGRGETLPVDFTDRVIYYVGPVDAVRDEAVGPAGPTTATRMDRFTEMMLARTGLVAMIGKGERGSEAIAAIKRHGAASLIATGGAAFLVAKAIRKSRVLAFADLGMEAVHEFTVEDMPVTVAVDAMGTSIHQTGPAAWRKRIAAEAAVV